MFQDEHKASSLAKDLLPFDYVIVDTCSLMDDDFPFFMDVLDRSRSYIDKNLPIYIPLQCIEELKKHSKDRKDNVKKIAAKRAIKIVKMGKRKKILTPLKIEIPKENIPDRYEDFADRAIFVKVSADRLSQKILAITQDKGLAKDLLSLNRLQSQLGRWIVVEKIVSGGALALNKGEERFLNKQASNQFANRADKPKKEENKPLPKKEEKKPAGEALQKIVANDARLSANLSNSTYPLEKKVADLRDQLTQLGKHKASELAELHLLFNQAKLEEKLKTLSAELKGVHIKKDTEKREEKQKEKEAGTRLWYGTGETLADAFRDCASHYGYVIRDATVAYYAPVHGKLDLTTSSLNEIVEELLPKLVGERREQVTRGGVTFLGQAVNKRFRAWISLGDQTEEPKKEEAKPVPKAKPAKAAPKKADQAEEKPAEPKPAKKPAKKAAPKETEPKPAPAEAKAEKPAPAKAKKPAKKAEEPKKEKPAEKKEEAKPEIDAFTKAKNSERRLQALIPNPNYKKEDKVKDLKDHLALINSLPKEQRDELALQPEAIKTLISVMK